MNQPATVAPPPPPARSDRDPYTSFGVQFGDPDNPTNVNIVNPGFVDLESANPELFKILQSRRMMMGQFGQYADQFMDPALYAQRRARAVTGAETGAMNQMARMGLAGSSAGIGMMNDAAFNAGMAMDDRQMMDMIRMAQVENSLLGGAENTIRGIQGGYKDFQDQYLQLVLGAEQANAAADASDANMWAGIAQGIGTVVGGVGGFLLGGPAGAAAGATIGSGLGKAGGSINGLENDTSNAMMNFASPSVGSGMGYGDFGSVPWDSSAAMYTYPTGYGF